MKRIDYTIALLHFHASIQSKSSFKTFIASVMSGLYTRVILLTVVTFWSIKPAVLRGINKKGTARVVHVTLPKIPSIEKMLNRTRSTEHFSETHLLEEEDEPNEGILKKGFIEPTFEHAGQKRFQVIKKRQEPIRQKFYNVKFQDGPEDVLQMKDEKKKARVTSLLLNANESLKQLSKVFHRV